MSERTNETGGSGQNNPDGMFAKDVGGRFEKHVDGRPRKLDQFIHGQAETRFFHQQMIVRGSQVNPAGNNRINALPEAGWTISMVTPSGNR